MLGWEWLAGVGFWIARKTGDVLWSRAGRAVSRKLGQPKGVEPYPVIEGSPAGQVSVDPDVVRIPGVQGGGQAHASPEQPGVGNGAPPHKRLPARPEDEPGRHTPDGQSAAEPLDEAAEHVLLLAARMGHITISLASRALELDPASACHRLSLLQHRGFLDWASSGRDGPDYYATHAGLDYLHRKGLIR